MAFLLPNLSPPLLLQSKSKEKPTHQTLSQSQTKPNNSLSPLSLPSSLTTLHTPLAEKSAQLNTPGDAQDKQPKDDFYVNLGLAVRTLREDLPLIFTKDLNYDIYRDDITFKDPLNTFTGIENYKLIFWALRFHGRILFREISLEVYRIWQPSENVILIRWNLKGVPRVPWEAKGQFQGTSRYKLDRNGKIYEHKVDNLAFNFPQPLKPAASVLDLVAACPASPNPTFLWGPVDRHSSSWVEFYRAVRKTLDDQEGYLLAQDGLVTCS
ncbi:NTF2-like domain containing protein [Parasponia andersonii]|uniref:NTF2-like domain containing protein n=1 Tax=Parasponia andersonii TaxID=3476 RepID=A0A2P5ABM3_PARAD|nr:NTF2-like domain containing protein [Parasponia andersonii]